MKEHTGDKRPFDLDVALERLRIVTAPLPMAALFDLAEQGYNTLFEQLIACLISIRTYDEVSLPTALRLFNTARGPETIRQLSVTEIDALIRTSTFHERKAEQIQHIAKVTAEQYGGALPCDRDVLLSFPGVGPKCANLALGIACGEPFISVDIHVHRVTNRWGVIATATPEHSLLALERILPRKHWTELNRLLVPFGKHICTGTLPHCSTCPLLEMCKQVGVNAHR